VTLSTPIKVVALAGLACILALGAFLALATLHHRDAAQTVAPVVVHHETPAPRPAPHRLVLSPGLPAPIHRALERSRVAVGVLYAPGIAGDHDTVAAARKGAHAAGVPFVALDVSRAAIAQKTAFWLPGVGDPAVVVVERPGRVVSTIQGWTDEIAVAQAAANAR
jgi:hypothetical protein